MTGDKVLYDVDGGVAEITLNKPEEDNALSYEMYREILAGYEQARDDDVSCLVIQGAGDAFSIGYGVDTLEEEDLGHEMGAGDYIEKIQDTGHALIKEVIDFPLPTVAKIDGPAFGDAACLAIGCDISLASEDARIGFTHVRLGLSVDMAATYLLPRLAGTKHAKELTYTGKIIGPERAAEIGLINNVYPADEFDSRCDQLISTIADGPPIALRQINHLIDQGAETSLDHALKSEATTQTMLVETGDFREAVAAFQEDRKPHYEGQ
jgi:enoyl-CoA hydratase/carnithine racemase